MSRIMSRVVLAALAAGAAVLAQSSSFAADAKKGKDSFMKFGCWQCHGTEGQGSFITSAGKVLAPDPMPLDTFIAYVRTSDRAMPPYSEKVLSNEDLTDMHAYLASIPKPKDYKSIPLLNQ